MHESEGSSPPRPKSNVSKPTVTSRRAATLTIAEMPVKLISGAVRSATSQNTLRDSRGPRRRAALTALIVAVALSARATGAAPRDLEDLKAATSGLRAVCFAAVAAGALARGPAQQF